MNGESRAAADGRWQTTTTGVARTFNPCAVGPLALTRASAAAMEFSIGGLADRAADKPGAPLGPFLQGVAQGAGGRRPPRLRRRRDRRAHELAPRRRYRRRCGRCFHRSSSRRRRPRKPDGRRLRARRRRAPGVKARSASGSSPRMPKPGTACGRSERIRSSSAPGRPCPGAHRYAVGPPGQGSRRVTTSSERRGRRPSGCRSASARSRS